MRLQEYWGVGPKTSDRLQETLGVAAAVEAIESADVRALTEAGIPAGRATRILRRANGDAGMATLGTRDARTVYDELLSLAGEHAVTRHAGDRIRVLTPLSERAEREARLDEIEAAREAWAGLDDDARDDVLAAFATYDEAGGTERAAVEAAVTLRDIGLDTGPFAPLSDADEEALSEAMGALGYVDGDDVLEGADETLDRLRRRLEAAERLESGAFDLLETVREAGARNLDDFEHAVADYVAAETELSRDDVLGAAADDPVGAADFVSTTLRTLSADLRERVDEREDSVAADLHETIENARDDIDIAVDAVEDSAFALSLARFADAYDLVRPELGGNDDQPFGVAAVEARHLFLDDDVQPVTYAVGHHTLSGEPQPPADERVTVLTGANSGGKTTLLETLCQVALLAAMGLPVPASRAQVGDFDTVVFHRRHASFNAGVLESTLKSIVPPLSGEGRTLMLVDEFEAITEPGRAADLLGGLVGLTVDRNAVGVYVTHLADDLSPLPAAARIDGIFAEGLTPDLKLRVDYQPRFGTVGKSTPEFIVSRLVANAKDNVERQGFQTLAAAVGEEAVQQTLSDARWRE
ncbi:DNA mismatch repair protein [Haloprofundus marisrubri]|uniref:DNA mismatch repair protein n=1 Tax=Haloprofundus marisrubri TaxID=1514971 RepID=A0A0W1RA96_9EURY|nr:DNA mismatch repair protein [Haloprofundus marisrubri]KTG10397.1 DNA mismatch repair protein [Haloprofundus marisrubri]